MIASVVRASCAAAATLLLQSSHLSAQPRPESHVVWLNQPATLLVEGTPLGNGRLGATVFGHPDVERVVLNENGLWSGSPQDADRPDAASVLPEIRRLLLAGRNAEAEALVNAHFTCAGPGSGKGAGANVPFGCYQTLGDLLLTFSHPGAQTPVSEYRRQLDLREATARVTFRQNGIRHEREAWVSAPDQVVVLRLRTDRPHALSFSARLARAERATVTALGGNELLLAGQLNDGREGGTGVRFAALLHAQVRGGSCTVEGDQLVIRDADEVELRLSAASDIRTFAGRGVTDAGATARHDLDLAKGKDYATLRRDHVADYQRWFNRVSLELGAPDSAAAALPTPQRLQRFQTGVPDPSLAALYFHFGRYLLISSSRPGGLPANLQGIWADQIQTPWNGDWHLNINAQMNYWPAEVCNLSELHQPLFDLIASLEAPGRKTAQAYYGARGWVAFLLANPWGFTSPGESASWGSTVSCSAWLCQHLWDHYLFTHDETFLRRVYPLLKGAGVFYLDMLIEDPRNGWWVTAPSNSPENAFLLPDGSKAHVCLGPTADMQLLRYLFDACIEASERLDLDPELRRDWTAKRAKLAPTRIGEDGRVLEWLDPVPEADPQHRHIAHLWGLYPGHEITPDATPALAAASEKTLQVRGDGGTGWSLAYKLALWARLGRGDRAHDLLAAHLKPAATAGDRRQWTGGTYPNLWDAHPPFQIDGNFGGTAAIAEMLVQSRVLNEGIAPAAELQLLPALPTKWPAGSVRGLRTRGGLEVDLSWDHGTLTQAVIRSVGGRTAQIRFRGETRSLSLAPGQSATLSFRATQP
ncbi:MAG: glycoside hydrolase family 95 protein [Opitutaceae bacterium]